MYLSKSDMKFQLWLKRFKEQGESGLTVKDYCNQNNLSLKAYYYWHHKAVNYAFIQKEAVQAESLSKPVMNAVSCTDSAPKTEFVSVPVCCSLIVNLPHKFISGKRLLISMTTSLMNY